MSFLAAVLLALGAVTAGTSGATGEPTPASPDSRAETTYRTGPSDVLHIEVFGEPSLTGDFTVSTDGTIVYPLLGTVQSAGLTALELRDDLADKLARDYLYDPKVSVTVKDYKSQKATVLGNVNKPGVYFLDGPLRLLDLLSRAGGISPRIEEVRRGNVLSIVRPADSGQPDERLTVDLFDLLVAADEKANVAIRDGDMIYVPGGASVHVVGEVKRPGSFAYEQGMTVLKAISLAGGSTNRAARGAVIRRIQDGKEIKIKAGVEDAVAPEDIVEVPLSFW